VHQSLERNMFPLELIRLHTKQYSQTTKTPTSYLQNQFALSIEHCYFASWHFDWNTGNC